MYCIVSFSVTEILWSENTENFSIIRKGSKNRT